MLEIKYVESKNKDFWYSLDKHLPEQEYGRALMEHWEQDMKAQGYGMVLISTQVDDK